MSANTPTLPNDETVPNRWAGLGEHPYTGPVTGQQLAALDMLEEIAMAQDVQITTELPPYTGPMTGDQLGLLGTGERDGLEVAEREMAPTRRVSRSRRQWKARVPAWWPLLVVLVVQAALSLRLIWSNTAYNDEALYIWAGHLEWDHWLHGLNISSQGFPGYFSGAPVVYPPIAAVADTLGGLAAARCLSLLFLLGSTMLLWSATRRIYDRQAAAYACALFVFVGTGQDLASFATYDAMALFCLALAFWLGTRAAWAKSPAAAWALYACCALAMALGDAAKYAAALWDPAVIVSAGALAVWHRGCLRSGVRAAAGITVMLAVALAVALRAAGPDYVKGILFTTLSRAVGTDVQSPQTVLWLGFTYAWVIIILALAAVIYTSSPRRAETVLAAALAFAVLAAPLNEARIHTYASLYKHVAYGAWFGAISGGWLLARASKVSRKRGWRIVAAVLAVAAVAGYGQGTTQFNYWPNMTAEVAALRPIVAPQTGQIGVYGTNGTHWATYYLMGQTTTRQVSELYPASGQYIRQDDYGVITIDTWTPLAGLQWSDKGQEAGALVGLRLASVIEGLPQYRLVATIPWRDAWYSGETRIWVKASVTR